MGRSTVLMARKRERARLAGLCITCCKCVPPSGRVTCGNCKIATLERKRRKRERDRATAEFQQIILAHERAGDKAHEHRLFDNAAQHYQEGLNVGAIAPDDVQRLAQKLRSVSLLTSDPAAVNIWLEHGLGSYLSDAQKAEQAVETLAQRSVHMWLASKGREALALCEEAVRIAERYGTSRLSQRAKLRLTNRLVVLGRFDTAARYIDTLGSIELTEDLALRMPYYWQKGFIAAMRGSPMEAHACFGKAVRCAKDGPSLYQIATVLWNYAIAAMALGDIERARAHCEEALLIVRRNHAGWLVPQICTVYAQILARMGRYTSAHDYLLEALASDAHAPILEEQFASVGIPIALQLKDEATLQKCNRPAAIDLAFQSGEPARVGPVAAAFARLYAKQNQKHKASTLLLHRALEIVTYVDESIDLPLAVAQYGARSDIPAARALLEARIRLPTANVAQACLLLFDALAAQRTQQGNQQQWATEAAEQFDRLQWYAYSDLARSLLPFPHPISAARTVTVHEQGFSSALPTLTDRERQIVELVLKGLTSRAVATELAISPRTVDSHMNTIMNRLGIRSRYQLADVLAEPPIPER